MLVRFSSTKTESITMFGDVAVQLIRMLGGSGSIPGAMGAEDIPNAVERLRHELQTHAERNAGGADAGNNEDDEDDREPQVALITRARPLIDLLERAGAANVAVMWEAG